MNKLKSGYELNKEFEASIEGNKQFNFQIPLDLKKLLEEAASKRSTTMTQYLIDLLVADLKGTKQKEMEDLDVIIKQARELIMREWEPSEWDYQGLQNNVNFFGTQKDWNQSICTAINKKAADIAKGRPERSGYVNRLVIYSSEVFGLFQNLNFFHRNDDGLRDKNKSIGVLGSRYDVFFQLDRARPHAVDFFKNEEFLGELTLKNIPNRVSYKGPHTWDYNGLKNNPNYFGTQRDWNNLLPEEIVDRAYGCLTDEPCYLQVEVFSPQMFDLFMHCGFLSNIRIDRHTQSSSAEMKDKRIYLYFDNGDSRKENILRISKTVMCNFGSVPPLDKNVTHFIELEVLNFE